MIQNWKRRAGAILAALMMAGCAGGCGPKETAEPSSVPVSSAQDTEEALSSQSSSSAEEPQDAVPINPLTGEPAEESLLTQRPVAVMINNIREAQPQRGISEADIIYEMPVEGSVTRLMAVFSDYRDLPDVGSVRSARHDFVELALALDAFYVHIGQSAQAKEALERLGVDHIDGTVYTSTGFWKDEVRAQTKASEHCWFTDGAHIQSSIDKMGTDMTRAAAEPIFRFADEEEFAAWSGESLPALQVTAPLSGSVTATFTYEPESGTYRKGQYGEDHVDENTGEAVRVKNVFLMYTDVTLLADGLHKDVDLSQGSGYYLSEGEAVAVTFRRPSESERIRVFDAATGEELPVHPGNSWFCIAPSEYAERLDLGA